ncbi:MAG: YfcE family phosphodiesterase [Xanthomonadales bacterium]|nr:YfcE family phosphodiesterase [Xanthomonadales bacterium]
MSRIGLISDVHATPEPVAEALAIFRREGCDRVVCAGDIAGYGDRLEETIALLSDAGCAAISGNHDRWQVSREQGPAYLESLPRTLELQLEGCTIQVVHASPPRSDREGIVLLDEQGRLIPERVDEWTDRLSDLKADVLIVGHTHQVFAERLGQTLVVNPGSTVFNHACAILTLPQEQVDFFSLSGRPLIKAWHWGMKGRGRSTRPRG